MSLTLHVVSHTHWDREWYLPFELFRMRLVDLVDHLLDLLDRDPDFRHFDLDGQGIVLEDYLRMRPGNEERLRRHIKEGRITIGPWYVLNDEFLVSGESTVRSLLLGHKVVSRFGPVMKVGYIPDQFGNISQMPQILRNFGVDNCIFGRGWQAVDGRTMEFNWKSPDGSAVMSSLMWFWYNNAQDIPEDPEAGKKFMEDIRDRMKGVSGSSHLLLMNGVDHLEAQYNLSKALAGVQPGISEKLVHSSLPAYVDALRSEAASGKLKLEDFTGELREDRWGSILAGVLSSRIYLKQANERCMRLLESYAEPASVWAFLAPSDSSGATRRYPAGELEYAWKLLMENHPHDSICGCSTDEVHAEMMTRFVKVEQLAGELKGRALRAIADRVDVDGDALVVFNTLTWDRTDVVRATIDIPLGDPDRFGPQAHNDRDWPAMEIVGPDGESVPYTLISSQKVARKVLHPEKLPHVQWVRRFQVEFVAESVPSMGYMAFKLRRAERTPEFPMPFDVLHRTGDALVAEFSGFGFEDCGDIGDEYNYRRPVSDQVLKSCGDPRQVKVLYEGPASAEISARYELVLPRQAAPDGHKRSDETAVTAIEVVKRVYKGIDRTEFDVTIDNQSKDHRLRAIFPTGAEGCAGSAAGGAFDVVERPLHLPKDWPASPPPSTFHPLDGWVDASNSREGLAVLVDGLREYELYGDEQRTLAVTLLRCIGRLSGGPETPDVQLTPDAQCPGVNHARFAVYAHKGDWKQAKIWKQALEFNVPLAGIQVGDLDRSRTIEHVSKDLPASASFVRLSCDALVPSALKKEESGLGVVLRFYNILTEEMSGQARVMGARKAWKSNMAEERLEELPVTDGSVDVTLRGREIATLIFE